MGLIYFCILCHYSIIFLNYSKNILGHIACLEVCFSEWWMHRFPAAVNTKTSTSSEQWNIYEKSVFSDWRISTSFWETPVSCAFVGSTILHLEVFSMSHVLKQSCNWGMLLLQPCVPPRPRLPNQSPIKNVNDKRINSFVFFTEHEGPRSILKCVLNSAQSIVTCTNIKLCCLLYRSVLTAAVRDFGG